MKSQLIKHIYIIFFSFMLMACGSNNDKTTLTTLTSQEKAISKIESYASSNGSSSSPTLQDYLDAGVTGLDASELADINEVVENLTAAEVDSTSEIQALADALGVNIDTAAPVFTSSNTASVNENQTSAITLVATDASVVTYSISGTDAASFTVDGATGVVTFKTAPDYETKASYVFTATATDVVNNNTDQSITITILDLNEGTPPTIMHNGVGYNTVTSPHTGKVWLDRNLGATQACTAAGSKNTACFGGYYQWGRGTDGHENPVSETRDSRIITGTKFIIGFSDWTEVDTLGNGRKLIWSKTDGSSVCPVDYRVPTSPEFIAEDSLNFLDLPASGRRYTTGLYQPDVGDTNEYGHLWTNSPRGDGSNAHYVIHKPSFFNTITHGLRSFGYNLRCIKD